MREIPRTMSPLRKVSPPAKVEMRNSQQPLMEMIQAGRSNVSLATDINFGPSNSPSSTTDTVRPDSRRLSNTPHMERRASNLSMNRKSYLPVVPSPLNPSTSSTTVNSSDERKSGLIGGTVSPAGSSSSGDLPLPTATNSNTNTQNNGNTNKRGKGLSSPQQLLRQKSELAGIGLQTGDISRTGTPKGLKDLGHDYSRYPNSRTQSSYGPEPYIPGPIFISEASTSSDSLSSTIPRNPFRDSSAALIDNPERWSYPDDRVAAFDPYFGGEKGFILYDDEIEDDDNLHMPNENDDRDFKPTFHEWMEKKSLINAIGGVLMVIGLLCVFILLPVLTFTTKVWGAGAGGGKFVDYGPEWAHVNNVSFIFFCLAFCLLSISTLFASSFFHTNSPNRELTPFCAMFAQL